MNKEILRIRAERAAAITLAVIIGSVGLKSIGTINKDSACSIEVASPGSWFVCPVVNLAHLGEGVKHTVLEMAEDIPVQPGQ